MRRSIILILLTIICYGYLEGQTTEEKANQLSFPSNISEEKKLERAISIIDTLQNKFKRKQLIEVFIESLRDDILLAEAYTQFAEQEEERGNFVEAEYFYQKALAIKKKRDKTENDQEEIGRGLFRVGYILLLQNEAEKALPYFLKSEAIFKENESYIRLSVVYAGMGDAYGNIGNYKNAIERLEESISLAKENGYELGQANALLNLSEVYIKMNNPNQAILKGEESLVLYEKLEQNEGAAKANLNIGSAYFYKDENELALKYYLKALSYEGINKALRTEILGSINTIRMEEERYGAALNIYFELLEDDTYPKSKEFLVISNLNIGNIYYRLNDYHKAEQHFKLAENITTDINDIDLECEIMRQMVDNYYFLKQPDDAREYLDRWVMAEEKRNKEYTAAMNLGMDQLTTEKLIAEQKQQQNLIIALMAIIGAIIGIFIAVFYAYRQKNRRKMAEQEKQIAKREKEIAMQEKQQKIDQVLQESEIKTIRARLNGIDEERSRISKDLHDSVGVMLTSTKLHFEALSERLDHIETNNRERFDRAFDLLGQAQQETRRVVHNMANLTLVKHGLIAQVEELISSIKTAGMININLVTKGIDEDTKWDSTIEMKIYKILQELINNTLKYAEADNLNIQIQQLEDELSLNVVDDGKGFDTTAPKEGMGMHTVEDRVKDLGGNLNILSTEGQGTSISIENINLN